MVEKGGGAVAGRSGRCRTRRVEHRNGVSRGGTQWRGDIEGVERGVLGFLKIEYVDYFIEEGGARARSTKIPSLR